MKKFLVLCSIVCLCSACVAAPAATPTMTATPISPTATITPTIIWFPPTATNTPFPTPIITPTADMRPQLGDILFEDDFTEPDAWQLEQTSTGNIAFGTNELTIAIGETNATLTSIRESPVFTDFYLEITASPSMCRDLDEYGVLFRVNSASDFYRFSLSCNGQVRLDRLVGGDASSPQPWMMSGAVPPGAPSSSRIGVAALGSNMDFYVNGQYQFSIKDPVLTSGGLGVFARSTNKMAVTVNFSDLAVYEIIK